MADAVSLLKNERPRAHVTLAHMLDGMAGVEGQRRNWQIMGPGERNNQGKDWIAYEAGAHEFIEHHFPDEATALLYVEAKMMVLVFEAAGLKVSRFDAERFIRVTQERKLAASS